MPPARLRAIHVSAITAIAHTLLKIAYQVLKTGTPYQDLGADFYTRRESRQHKQAWLERQLQKLHPGCTITITISPEEFRASLATFLARLPGPEVSWVDEHLLVVIGASRRNQAEPDGPAILASQAINDHAPQIRIGRQ